MYALIDCNNFYVSCERLFRPDLQDKPIIVLSNNDGCVIARSNQAKELGIKMGEPFFKVQAVCKQHSIFIFSSNYTLYGDLSQRVMAIIGQNWPDFARYSIDEAFLDLTTLPNNQIDTFCWELQKKILKSTGIPTSIGIGSSKTLAKVANHIAKKRVKIAVFNVTGQEETWLAQLDVRDVWGVGRQWQKKLIGLGVSTALDLAKMNPTMIKDRFNVILQRTILELNGKSCHGLEVAEPKKSILSSCSFGTLQTDYSYLNEAIAYHCGTAWAKLRKQGLVTQYISVSVRSNPFRHDLPQYTDSIGFRLVNPTDDLRQLTQFAKKCLKKVFKQGISYQKCGVLFTDLIDKQYCQMDLFHQPSKDELAYSEKLMSTIDVINKKYGARTIHLAAEGLQKTWSMKRQLKSPHYTTNWSELPTALTR